MRTFFLRFFLTTLVAFGVLFTWSVARPTSVYADSIAEECDASTYSAEDYDACVAAAEAEADVDFGSSADDIEFDSSSSSSSTSSTRTRSTTGVDGQYTKIESQGLIFANICPDEDDPNDDTDNDCPCRDKGECSLEDVLQVFVNLSYFILGISGSVLLFVFVYGGFKWVFSRGNPKWIEAGKEAIVGGVIGLVIIFGSYVAINFILASLMGKSTTGNLETTLESDTIKTE